MLLLPIIATFLLYVMTTWFLPVLSSEMKAWRFGYLGQEILIVLFLLWSYLLLQRWFGKDEAECLRSSEEKHSCLSSLLVGLALEFTVLMLGVVVGAFFHVNYVWEAFRLILFQALLGSVLYILTVILRTALPPLALAVAYCLFCATMGSNNSLGWICLIQPGRGDAATLQTILSLWPIVLISVILFAIADRLEKKLIWAR